MLPDIYKAILWPKLLRLQKNIVNAYMLTAELTTSSLKIKYKKHTLKIKLFNQIKPIKFPDHKFYFITTQKKTVLKRQP